MLSPANPSLRMTQTVVVTRSIPSEIESAQKGPELHKDDEAEFARIDQLVLDSSFAFLSSPKALRHPLIVATRSALREGGADDRKIQHPPYGSRSLNIRVGKGDVARALEFMASLIATAESHGAKITIIDVDSRQPSTVLEAWGERLEFKIHETAKQNFPEESKTKQPDYSVPRFGGKRVEYTPTGKMIFEISTYGLGLRHNWKEGKHTLADYHAEIVATLFKVTILRRRETLKREAERRAQEWRDQELALLRRRIAEEEKRVKRLEDEAENWFKAKRIRAYVVEVAEEKKKLGEEMGPDTPLGIWVSWALQQADRMDPMVKSPSSILDRKKELPPDSGLNRWR